MVKDRLTQTDYETLAAFRHALRRFLGFSEKAAHDAGLTPAQHQALLVIKARQGRDESAVTGIGQLAEALLIAPHSATELATRLEAAGLVGRIADSRDKRRTGLVLTERAEDILAELTRAHRREVRLLAPELMAIIQALGAPD